MNETMHHRADLPEQPEATSAEVTRAEATIAPILIIGASGKTGSRVAALLRQRGLPVRAVSRHSRPVFDWERPETWPDALAGVKVAYICYYPDLASDSAPAHLTAATAAMLAAGVESVVLLSGRGEDGAERCENIVRQSGLDFTLVRASWFMQNFSEGNLLDSVLDGMIALPAGDAREPFIDVDDLAEVAARALEDYARGDDRHSGELYEVTGPRLLSFAEAAAEISLASGRPVEYLSISSEEFHGAIAESAGAEMADLLTELCREVFDGRNEHLADGVQRALGRPPRDFSVVCADAAASGAWAAVRVETERAS